MPLYEFECDACKTRFDRIQKYTDPNPDACPTCGTGPIRKMPSSPAIQFKGSGFYITDYAKKSPDSSSKPAGDKSGGDNSGTSSSSGSDLKSDSKSESKAESKSSETKSTDSKSSTDAKK